MNEALLVSMLLLVSTCCLGQTFDHFCLVQCQTLRVRGSDVEFVDEGLNRTLKVGRYVRVAQSVVPGKEAPIRDLRTTRGWRVVASVFLDRQQQEVRVRLRFFAPGGLLKETEELLMELEEAAIGNLFGGSDEIVMVTSNEEHAYNAETEIWLLPSSGGPDLLLSFRGGVAGWVTSGRAGVKIGRQTYDGVDSSTKGFVQEFYLWDRRSKTLVLRKD
jgi:hypothetical protein